MTGLLDAEALLRWCGKAAAELARLAGEIDALNVFPVADADTGTNMWLTMTPAAGAARQAATEGAGLATAAAAASQASLMHARGNSGLILSQLLAGFADALTGCPAAGPADLARCLDRAAEFAYAAVADPVEGTILSVARAAATAAREAVPPGTAARGPGQVAFAAAQGAAAELARTPLRLGVLARAGVVDAGGRGLLAVLAALVHALTGQLPQLPAAPVVALNGDASLALRETGGESYRYEVCYLLSAPQEVLPALRQRLASLGDSVVIAGAGQLWRVHVHVNDIGAALEAGRQIGEPQRVTTSRLVAAAVRGDRSSGQPAGA